MSNRVVQQESKKGDILSTIEPWSIVTFRQPFPSLVEFTKDLPRFVENFQTSEVDSSEEPIKTFVAQLLRSATHRALSVVSAIHLVLANQIPNNGYSGEKWYREEYNLHDDEQEAVAEGWALLQDHIEWRHWLTLYRIVKECLLVANVCHPLVQYCDKILPFLPPEEILKCWSTLEAPLHLKPCDPENTFLVLSQNIQDKCQSSSLGVIVFNPFVDKERYPMHSCLPNTGIELTPEAVNIIAMFDLGIKEDLTISYADISLPREGRLKELQSRFGSSFDCTCIQCCADLGEANLLSFKDLTKIGHLAFQHHNYERALKFYKIAVTLCHQDNGDVMHAIGAVFLAQNQFLNAQRHWRDCTTKIESISSSHPGIVLQLQKQQAFRYFHCRPHTTPSTLKYQPMFNGQCFVTEDSAVSIDDCINIIAWTEGAQGWTTSRHYAVPTNDVPVHQIPVLLDWFNHWMEETIYPLLGLQFHLDPNHFYVHDAFVVRYQGLQTNNHLPIHVDEATHSFVLALNNDFSGGGTCFVDYNTTIVPKNRGTLVSFRGDRLRHGGNVVSGGVRYILAAFLYHDSSSKKRGRSCVTSSLKEAKQQVSGFSFGFHI